MAIAHIGSTAGNLNPTSNPTVTLTTISAAAHGFCAFGGRGTNQAAPSALADTGNNTTWTKVADNDPLSSAQSLSIWSRAVDAGDSLATVTATMSNSNGTACGSNVFSGSSGTLTQITYDLPGSGVESTAGLTIGTGGWFLIWIYNRTNDLNVTNVSGSNCGALTPLYQHLSTGGSDCGLACWGIQYDGDVGTITWSQTNGASGTIVAELLPAAAGGGAPRLALLGVGV